MKTAGIFFICLFLVIWAGGCSQEVTESVLGPQAAVTGAEKSTTEGEETAGNNLSFPVIWSDGYELPLRGIYGAPSLLGAVTEVDGRILYPQQDPDNLWQAESRVQMGGPLHVDWVDWGDNLEARSWPDRSKVRVETVLYQDLEQPMAAFDMYHISGLGIDEMWGTDGTVSQGAQATVYSHNARLTIQKVPDDPAVELAWSNDLTQWVRTDGGPVNAPVFNSPVYEGSEGATVSYSAEINVKGKVIYGMLWDLRKWSDGPGIYRLTFSFDTAGPVPLNTLFDEDSRVFVGVEEGEVVPTAEPAGGMAVIDPARNMTFLDLEITEGGGGGGGNRPDRGPGGGNGNGGGH